MSRPYHRHDIKNLEFVFSMHKENLEQLKLLNKELEFRHSGRADTLHYKVKNQIRCHLNSNASKDTPLHKTTEKIIDSQDIDELRHKAQDLMTTAYYAVNEVKKLAFLEEDKKLFKEKLDEIRKLLNSCEKKAQQGAKFTDETFTSLIDDTDLQPGIYPLNEDNSSLSLCSSELNEENSIHAAPSEIDVSYPENTPTDIFTEKSSSISRKEQELKSSVDKDVGIATPEKEIWDQLECRKKLRTQIKYAAQAGDFPYKRIEDLKAADGEELRGLVKSAFFSRELVNELLNYLGKNNESFDYLTEIVKEKKIALRKEMAQKYIDEL